MKSMEELKKAAGLCITGALRPEDENGNDAMYKGFLELPTGFRGTVVFGPREGGRWEHVSISHYNRRKLPTWEDMCRVKDIFFGPEEMAVQIHPEESSYVHSVGTGSNKLENVLHLWRPVGGDWSALNSAEVRT